MNDSKETASPILPLEQQRVCVFRLSSDAAERLGQILTPALTALDSIGEQCGTSYYMIFAGERCLLWENDDVVIVPSQHGHYWAVHDVEFSDETETDPNPVVQLVSVMRWTSGSWTAQEKRTMYFKELTDKGVQLTVEDFKENSLRFVLEDRDGQWLVHKS